MTETIIYSDLKNSMGDLEKYGNEFDLVYAENIVGALRNQGVIETFLKHLSWEGEFGDCIVIGSVKIM